MKTIFAGLLLVAAGLSFVGLQIMETNRLMIADSYQMRAQQTTNLLLHLADGRYTDLVTTLDEFNWPENRDGLGRLAAADVRRLLLTEAARWTHFDNLHYQYQQGLVDEEFYNLGFRSLVRVYGPAWKALGQPGLYRASFDADLQEILSSQ
jgi:hypothetical protein